MIINVSFSLDTSIFAILRLRRSATVFIEHGNKGMGLNAQIHVQEAKAFLSNYVHTLGDMMPDSDEVCRNYKRKNYFTLAERRRIADFC